MLYITFWLFIFIILKKIYFNLGPAFLDMVVFLINTSFKGATLREGEVVIGGQ